MCGLFFFSCLLKESELIFQSGKDTGSFFHAVPCLRALSLSICRVLAQGYRVSLKKYFKKYAGALPIDKPINTHTPGNLHHLFSCPVRSRTELREKIGRMQEEMREISGYVVFDYQSSARHLQRTNFLAEAGWQHPKLVGLSVFLTCFSFTEVFCLTILGSGQNNSCLMGLTHFKMINNGSVFVEFPDWSNK